MWNAGPPDFLRREQEKKFTPVTAFPIEHPLNSVGVLRPVNDGTYEQTSIQPQYQTQGYEEAPAGRAKVRYVNNDDPHFVAVAQATAIGGGRSKHRRKKSRKTKTRRRKTKTRRRKTKTRRRKSRR